MLTQRELVKMIYYLGKGEENPLLACRLYNADHPGKKVHISVFEKLKKRFDSTGSVHYLKRIVNSKVFTEENELNVLLTLQENPHVSVRAIEKQLNLSKASVQRIIKKNRYHAYHISLHQALLEQDNIKRVEFCMHMQELLVDPENLNNILFTDEATFDNLGVVNKHNMHYYATENPHWVRHINFQNQWKLNVWGGIINNHIIGPHFFDGSLNGPTYLNFLQEELPLLLEDVDLLTRQQMFFQHDGAPAHYHNIVRTFLNGWRGQNWIGRGGPINWPPRSPDLTPLDFFLWGYVKQKVYQLMPTTAEDMKERIRTAFRSITVDTLERVRSTWIYRMEMCIQVEGKTFEYLMD